MPDQRDLRVLAVLEIVELGVAAIAVGAMILCIRHRRASEVLIASLALIGMAYLALAVRTAAGIVVMCRGLAAPRPVPLRSLRSHPYR